MSSETAAASSAAAAPTATATASSSPTTPTEAATASPITPPAVETKVASKKATTEEPAADATEEKKTEKTAAERDREAREAEESRRAEEEARADAEAEAVDLNQTTAGGAGGAPKTKDTNTKLGSSYYFFKSTPTHEQHKYAPKPIEADASPPPELQRQGSAWNAAGTWEDRDMTSWAITRVKELYRDLALTVPDGKVSIATVSKADGEASIVFTRGKKKVGYELHFTCEWSGEYKSTSVNGTIECPSVDYGDSDFQVNVKAAKTDAAHEAVRQALIKQKAAIRARMEILTKELLAA